MSDTRGPVGLGMAAWHHQHRDAERRADGAVGLDLGRGVGVEDRVEQAGEAPVDVLLAQLGVAPGALDALGDEAGLAHDAQVMGEGRLAQLEPGLLHDLGAPRLAVAREEADGCQPVRVGQCGQHPRQQHVVRRRLHYVVHHAPSINQSCDEFDDCRTVRFASNTFDGRGVNVADTVARRDAPDPRRGLMLPVVLLAMFMAGFDIWVVNVAAPSLQRDLHVSDAALQLIVGGYAFMYASGMVTGGRLGDLVGYRRLFMIGVVSFAAASLLCGLAQSSTELVAARLIQGLTGAVMVPQVLALITATFPVAERSRALAWFGVTMGVGFVSGQILGGGLIQANIFGLGWRAIFLVNVPVGVLAVIVASIVVPHAQGRHRPRLDPLGAVGVSAAIALALVPLTLGRDEGWPPWTWASLAAALPVLALTVAWERHLTRRGGEPLLDL